MARHELLRDRDAEALREHGAERLDLHLAEAGQRADALAQVVAVGRLRPDARRVAAVVLGDGRGELAARASPSSPGSGGSRASRGTAARGRPSRRSPGSSVPSRCFSRSGPRNACCTVTCWSSAKPTSSANGSSASSRHASSSSVNQSASGMPRSYAEACSRARQRWTYGVALLLLEVRERGVEARRVAALGREQRRPGLGEARADLAVDALTRARGRLRQRHGRPRASGVRRPLRRRRGIRLARPSSSEVERRGRRRARRGGHERVGDELVGDSLRLVVPRRGGSEQRASRRTMTSA